MGHQKMHSPPKITFKSRNRQKIRIFIYQTRENSIFIDPIRKNAKWVIDRIRILGGSHLLLMYDSNSKQFSLPAFLLYF
jgi:hypothetical protein